MANSEGCFNCVYAYYDGGLWMRTLWSGFPAGPMCANHPDRPGRWSETRCRICSNYRRKPEEPGAEAKTIILTNGMTTYVDACDYEELSKYSWRMVSGGYAGRYEKRKLILMHRQIMNPPPGMIVDHIHGNRLDNTRAHLRVCTYSENARNRAKNANSASRYIGVSYFAKRKKWVATIRLDDKYRFVGYFDDELEAARAYDYAAVLHLDDFARLNFPQEWPPERRAEVRARRGESSFAPTPTTENSRRRTAKPDGAKNAEGGRPATAERSNGRKAAGKKAASSRATARTSRATRAERRATRTEGKKVRKSEGKKVASTQAKGHKPQATGSKRSHAETQGRGARKCRVKSARATAAKRSKRKPHDARTETRK